MPRQPRLVVPGYPNHIILRGNNKSAIFQDDGDRRFFIRCLKGTKEKTKSKIYAYCFMTNHVHLLVEPSTENGLGNMIQSLGRRYVQYVNRRYKRTGTLWEGRFKSSLVNRDEYVLTCSRYIETNPVRAKMVRYPREYPWSSYAFKAEGKPDMLLDEDPIYIGLGKTPQERQEKYKEWVKEGISEQELKLIRSVTQRGGILGEREFIEKLSKIVVTVQLHKESKAYGVSEDSPTPEK
jgi:putative transposase